MSSENDNHKMTHVLGGTIGLLGLLSVAGAEDWPPVSSLTELEGSNGIQIDGTVTNGLLGKAVTATGDINGDGFVDLVLGSPNAAIVQNGVTLAVAGEVFVLLGPLADGPVDLDALRQINGGDGERGFVIQAESVGDQVGAALSFVGDVNGDGFQDLLIGAPTVTRTGGFPDGGAYLIFGQTQFPAELDLRRLQPADASNTNSGLGVIFRSAQVASREGSALANVGDVNGDGIGDLLIGNAVPESNGFLSARFAQVLLVYGRAADNPWPAVVDLIDMDADGDGAEGVVILGEDFAGLGRSVSGIDDFDGDGQDDFSLGSPSFELDNRGKAYIIPGRGAQSDDGFGGSLDLNLQVNRQTTYQIVSTLEDEFLGGQVAGVGDVNGDGRPDFAVGAEFSPRFSENGGVVFVIFGRTANQPLSRLFPVANLLPENGGQGIGGFAIRGREGDRMGSSIAGLGDLNGDGVDELLIGSTGLRSGGSELGGAVVIYGRPPGQPFPPLIEMEDLLAGNGNLGFVLTGAENQGRAGRMVGAAGDVNGDGSTDFLVGAELEDGGASNSGRAYVLFGSGNDAIGGFKAEHTAAYLDPDKPGQGVMIEVGTLDGEPALFATWYTYQNGNQQWFAMGPEKFSAGSNRIESALIRTSGADFGAAFDPAQVMFETWGTVEVSLDSCDSVGWTYQRSDGALAGSLDLVPLLSEVLGLPGCREDLSVTQAFGSLNQTLSGTWWNPARAGEGVVLDIDDRGQQPTAFLSWFTYDGGEQLWVVGSVPINPSSTALNDIPLIVTRGAQFGDAFDPSTVITEAWGQATLSFASCGSATLTYSRDLAGGGTEEGSISLVRFTEGLLDLDCVD